VLFLEKMFDESPVSTKPVVPQTAIEVLFYQALGQIQITQVL
jgi:hypothetical protein